MRKLFTFVIALLLLLPGSLRAQEQDPRRALTNQIQEAKAAARRNDLQALKNEYGEIGQSWGKLEESVRGRQPEEYRAIEDALNALNVAISASPANIAAATKAIDALEGRVGELGAAATRNSPTTSSDAKPSLATLLPKLQEAKAAVQRNDIVTASGDLDEFRQGWPEVEGVVASKDAGVYKRSEELMVTAAAALQSSPPQAAQAISALDRLAAGLAPFANTAQSYGIFDAAAILLREGLEALLIIAALLSFLQKSGNMDKRRWIWAGGIGGVAISVLGAVLIQRFFSSVITGTNRQLIEGITGLVAAAMLFYVSFWLHRKTQIQGWQRYIREKTDAALATGSVVSLAMLAFLAVFREGAETTLFYIGIAPSIAQRDLLLGLLAATLLLIALGVAIIGLGRRLPLTPFFRITGLLIFYLGFKFIGAGVSELQAAGVLRASTSRYLPSVDLIGLYPTWESTTLQLIMLAVAVGVVLWIERRRPARQKMQAA